jgi:hypothetical protein
MQTARWYEPKSLVGCEIPTLAAVSWVNHSVSQKTLKVPHRRWPMRPFTHKMIKMKHYNKRKLTQQEKGVVKKNCEAKIPFYRHFGRTRGHVDDF